MDFEADVLPSHAGIELAENMRLLEEGIEFTNIDCTDRGHRLVANIIDGGIEIVVLPGAKSEDPQDPIEVVQLSDKQMSALGGLCVSRGGAIRSAETVASLLRDGCQDPDRIACAAIAASLGLQEQEVLAELALMRDRQHRGRYGVTGA